MGLAGTSPMRSNQYFKRLPGPNTPVPVTPFDLCDVMIIPILLKKKLWPEVGKEFAQSRTMNEWCSLVWNLGPFDGEPRALSTEQLGHATSESRCPRGFIPWPSPQPRVY